MHLTRLCQVLNGVIQINVFKSVWHIGSTQETLAAIVIRVITVTTTTTTASTPVLIIIIITIIILQLR